MSGDNADRGSNITIRPLTGAELHRVTEIDVAESGTVVYKQAGRQIDVTPEEWHRPPRSAAAWGRAIASWQPILGRGGVALGAFDGDTLVGIAVLRLRLTRQMAQLAALFISQAWRRHGVATRLTDAVTRLARASGARELYVSATPSESAVGFYLSQGFRPTERVHAALFRLEPEDIHMVKPL